MAPPITYLVGGVQYLTLMVGWGGAEGIINPPGGGPIKPGFGRVLTFAIGGAAKLHVPRFGHQAPPSPAIRMNATPATVRAGNILFEKYCLYCHGVDAVAGSGIPDLRYATAETHHQFESIVLGGARESRGMPSFRDVLKREQLPALQAYILSRAAAAAKPASK
jgi:quinohemoprotein ethanol dehydrogenase